MLRPGRLSASNLPNLCYADKIFKVTYVEPRSGASSERITSGCRSSRSDDLPLHADAAAVDDADLAKTPLDGLIQILLSSQLDFSAAETCAGRWSLRSESRAFDTV